MSEKKMDENSWWDKTRPYGRWVFTSYLDSPPVYKANNHRYMAYQREACPSTGKLHWQGYVETHTAVRFRALQESCEIGKSWVEPAVEPALVNEHYVHKVESHVGDRFEAGKPAAVRKRKVASVEAASKPAIRVMRARPRVIVNWGCPNSGKSHMAKTTGRSFFNCFPSPTGWWYTEYKGQEVLLFDDLDKFAHRVDWALLFQICDEGELILPCKCGEGVLAEHTDVFITCNPHISEFMPTEFLRAFMSRVTMICEFKIPHPLSTRPQTQVLVQELNGSLKNVDFDNCFRPYVEHIMREWEWIPDEKSLYDYFRRMCNMIHVYVY